MNMVVCGGALAGEGDIGNNGVIRVDVEVVKPTCNLHVEIDLDILARA